jgi:hypothetical protein
MNGTGGTNDCIAYINKLASMASNNPPGTLFISASAGGYGNTNWYFDLDYTDGYLEGLLAEEAVTNADPTASVFITDYPAYITNFSATNLAGYFTVGYDGGHTTNYALDGSVVFSGSSGWYIMGDVDSYSGERPPITQNPGQSSFITWFASNAFGGTYYSNTPVGAITSPIEPGFEDNTSNYFGNWERGKCFIFTEYSGSDNPVACQIVGDPFVVK